MNKVWQERLEQSRQRIGLKRFGEKKPNYWLRGGLILLILCFCYPEYPKRLVYPHLFGKPYNQTLEISEHDDFEDVKLPIIEYKRHGYTYQLEPKTRYSVTARVAFVDHYDTWFNILYRGHEQNQYINLVPQDLLLLIGNMAKPENFDMFVFEHEERLGRVLCKGVAYKRSFMSFSISQKAAQKSQEAFNACHHLIKSEEYNNYHPIPATERINHALSMLVVGDVIHLEGYLVNVKNMHMFTGTRKNQVHQNFRVNGDKPGMCFILYTTKLIVNNYIYQ